MVEAPPVYGLAGLLLIAPRRHVRACYGVSMSSFSVPRENVLLLGLREGMKVADFGAGSGHYTRAVAAAVATSGRVYAVDIQEDMLKYIRLHTPDYYHSTVETVWGNIEKIGGSGLKTAALDAVILANVLFQVADRAGLIAEIIRVLKPGGKLLVVDWTASHGGIGPDAAQVIPKEEVEGMFVRSGFTKEKTFSAGPHHYGMILRKAV